MKAKTRVQLQQELQDYKDCYEAIRESQTPSEKGYCVFIPPGSNMAASPVYLSVDSDGELLWSGSQFHALYFVFKCDAEAVARVMPEVCCVTTMHKSDRSAGDLVALAEPLLSDVEGLVKAAKMLRRGAKVYYTSTVKPATTYISDKDLPPMFKDFDAALARLEGRE